MKDAKSVVAEELILQTLRVIRISVIFYQSLQSEAISCTNILSYLVVKWL